MTCEEENLFGFVSFALYQGTTSVPSSVPQGRLNFLNLAQDAVLG